MTDTDALVAEGRALYDKASFAVDVTEVVALIAKAELFALMPEILDALDAARGDARRMREALAEIADSDGAQEWTRETARAAIARGGSGG